MWPKRQLFLEKQFSNTWQTVFVCSAISYKIVGHLECSCFPEICPHSVKVVWPGNSAQENISSAVAIINMGDTGGEEGQTIFCQQICKKLKGFKNGFYRPVSNKYTIHGHQND